MMRNSLLIMLVLASGACADHVTDVGRDFFSEHRGKGSSGQVTVIQNECRDSASNAASNACIFDSAGHTFDVDGTVHVVTAPPPYGLNFRFDEAIVLSQEDLTTEGPDAAIKVYAAPYNVRGCPGTPDPDETKRVRARAVAAKHGGMFVLVDDALPAGTQVAIILDYAVLLADHLPLSGPVLGCESLDSCRGGYAARFYVGSEPPVVGASPKTEPDSADTQVSDF